MDVGFAGKRASDLPLSADVEVDAATGIASLTVPIRAPIGRHGIGPALSLVYSSRPGSSPFGDGWSLAGLPTISVRTREHLPRWDGTDTYELDGMELVPWLERTAETWAPRGYDQGDWSVRYLRPRRSAPHMRVELWRHRSTGRAHFRVRDANNALTVFGARPDGLSRIEDPDEPGRTFAWLPELQLDAHGNGMWLDYAAESLDGVDLTAPHERGEPSLAQRYLKRIRYCNGTPLVASDAVTGGLMPEGMRWHFQLVFDYGDHGEPPGATPDRSWPSRPDVRTSRRAGFEIRTYRLCRRILAFHDFDELGPGPTLTASLALTHAQDAAGSTLESIQRFGHRRDGGVETTRSVPPLVMRYAPPVTDATLLDAATSARENAPAGLAGADVSFVDLFGEGLPGILKENDGAWYYKSNLGGGEFDAQAAVLERPATRPGAFAFGDMDRNGNPELSHPSGRIAGAFELDREDGRWSGFRPFDAFPHVEALGGRAQWVDLNGDGRPDVVVAKPGALVWFASAGDGFADPVEVPLPSGAAGMPLATADPALDFYFADMTGDGLADLVRVSNGCVEYWPSLGNGRFGRGVVMDAAPVFGADADFDSQRVRFVDLDGSGTTDLLYLGDGEVTCWINACGNRFVAGPRFAGLPYFDNVSSVRIVDFLGDGRPCLVWSSPLPGAAGGLHYLPLTPEVQPRLLLSVDNSVGQETRLAYSSSATHYLRDREAGQPWSTRMPGHYAVVDRQETIDHIGDTRSVLRFEYHDGFYDGYEREPRGFGRTDVYDAEHAEATDGDELAFVAPSLTRTWFHLGTDMRGHHRPGHTYAGDAALPALPPHVIDDAARMTTDELDEALRSLAGQVVRREVYATDANGRASPHPFEVHQSSYRVRRAQPSRVDDPALFSVIDAEKLTATYELSAGDPRVTHSIVVEADEIGIPRRVAEVAYPRRPEATHDLAAQGRTHILVADTTVVHVDERDRFELGIPVESRSYELRGVASQSAGVVTRAALRAPAVDDALREPALHHVDLEDLGDSAPRARLVSWEQSLYWNDDRTAALPLGVVGQLAMVHHEQAACVSRQRVNDVLGDRADDARMSELGYVSQGDLWWRVDETHHFSSAASFSQPTAVERADGARTSVEYDPYALHAIATTDPLGIRVEVDIDYYALAPRKTIDGNGAIREAQYDALGVLVAETVRGSVNDVPWGFDPLSEPPPENLTIAAAVADPSQALGTARSRVIYDLDAWSRDGTPTAVLTLTHEQLRHDEPDGVATNPRIRVDVSYLDALGRELQRKQRVEPGQAVQRGPDGEVVVDDGGRPVLADVETRWQASGHVVYDTKQRPARQFEPFFTAEVAYEGDAVLQRIGTSTLTRYDAVGRVVAQDFANGTSARTTYGAWTVEHADANDTVPDSAYRALRESLPASDPERQALEHAMAHAGTTSLSFLDPLGRVAGTLERGGAAQDRRAESRLDILGDVDEVVDPRGLVAFRYERDMQGRILFEHSVDGGDSWALPDVHDRVPYAWNARGFEVERAYDAADRILFTHIRGGDGPTPLDHRVEEWVYGESLADRDDARRRNLIGQVAIERDGAGETRIDRHDPEGNVLMATQRLRADLTGEPDWRGTVPLSAEAFTTSSQYDAAGRVARRVGADGTVQVFEYLRSGPVGRVQVTTPDGSLVETPILDAASYNARGQRERMRLGNGVELAYDYERDTRRLIQQRVRRGDRTLQSIRYTYDPVGNLVRQTDDAQQGPGAVVSGASVPARWDYTYDAHYRLRAATGRVHQALLQHDYIPGAGGTFKGTRHLSLNNGAAVERYTREYDYDASGNLRFVKHRGASENWTRAMWISPSSNRSLLAEDESGTPVANPEDRFDSTGNLRELSHLRRLEWSWRGALARAVVIERPEEADDDERYAYAASGMRACKRTSRVVQGDQIEVIEKVYLGDCERKRILRGDTVLLERWTTHVGGDSRVAILHRWTRDDLGRETDDVASPRIHYQLTTHQGSTALELDQTGRVISYEEYFPYGGSAFIAGDNVREVQRKEYRYSGKERDDVTSFYYYGFRYYAPWLGRWLSPDPIGPEDDLNLYQFVRGDPVGSVDPLGLDSSRAGEIEFVNTPPPTGDDINARIASYGASLSSKTQRAGWEKLSFEDQKKHVQDPGRYPFVKTDPRADPRTTDWSVIDRETFDAQWLPAYAAWLEERGVEGTIKVVSVNPNSISGSGGLGTAEELASTLSALPTVTPPGAAAKDDTGGGAGAGEVASRPNRGDGKTSSGGEGKGQKKRQGDGDDGGGTGRDRGTGGGTTAGTGSYPSSSSHGVGKEVSDSYGDIGGRRGGRPGGILGGTPFARGDTPGGQGTSLDPRAPVTGAGAGTGRQGRRLAGTSPGTGAGSGSRGRRTGSGTSGIGARGTPGRSRSESSVQSRTGPASGDDGNAGEGPGGARQGAEGEYGWKDVALDVAGHLVGERSEEGDPHGVPGGWGLFGLSGEFFEWVFIITGIVSLFDLIFNFGEFLLSLFRLSWGLIRLSWRFLTALPRLLRLGWRGALGIVRGARGLVRGASRGIRAGASYISNLGGRVLGGIGRGLRWLWTLPSRLVRRRMMKGNDANIHGGSPPGAGGASRPPVSGALDDFGVYRYQWTGGGYASFERKGTTVVVDYLKRGGAPPGSGGAMLADALRAAGLSRPAALHAPNILQKTAQSTEVVRAALLNTTKALGARGVNVTTGIDSTGKHWIKIEIFY